MNISHEIRAEEAVLAGCWATYFSLLFWGGLQIFLLSFFLLGSLAHSRNLQTNSVIMNNVPEWVRSVDVRKVAGKIESKLEWSTRRTDVYWHKTQEEFNRVQSFGSAPAAVTVSTPTKSIIHMGPKVTQANFATVFGHELVHVIINQKYRGAVPKWLEEGLANHLSKSKPVDYHWLAKFPFPNDIQELAHPMKGATEEIIYRYSASQAIIEMLAKKCDLDNLLRLSVQRKMENYIETYCEIRDLNAAYREWVKKKASAKASS